MPRNMSFYDTVEQYRNHTKTVTRRLGWAFVNVGEVQNGVEKSQGLKKGQKALRLGQHRFVDLRWEPLNTMTDNLEYGQAEVIKEGFPDLTPSEFVEMFCHHNKCDPGVMVHRMQFEYVQKSKIWITPSLDEMDNWRDLFKAARDAKN